MRSDLIDGNSDFDERKLFDDAGEDLAMEFMDK